MLLALKAVDPDSLHNGLDLAEKMFEIQPDVVFQPFVKEAIENLNCTPFRAEMVEYYLDNISDLITSPNSFWFERGLFLINGCCRSERKV